MNAQIYTVTFKQVEGRRDWHGGPLWMPVIEHDIPLGLLATLLLLPPTVTMADQKAAAALIAKYGWEVK